MDRGFGDIRINETIGMKERWIRVTQGDETRLQVMRERLAVGT
jgi:hypothetical protein